ncbi:MAG TPA: GNVR domain-containing protein [archaeon]|nr:GNVR domain-containing protein [archaeon]
MAEKSFHLLDAVLLILRRWRLPATICAVTAVVASLVNFLVLPKWYEATTIIMPPQEKSAISGLGMLLSRMTDLPGGLSRIASGIAAINPSQFLFVVILNSRTVADSLIDKYNLEKVYKSKYRFEARKSLREHTTIDFPPEGHLVVSVEAKEDPELAKNMANEYVIQLNNVILDRGIYTASGSRKFLEEQLTQVKEHLRTLEDSLLGLQDRYKVIEPTSGGGLGGRLAELSAIPVEGTLEILGMLQAERESKNVLLGIKESVYTSRHPEVYLLKKEIAELDRALGKIQKGLPEIAMDYMRLYRAIRLQEELFMLLHAQYEEARIKEMDNTPTAIVLDPAVTPEYKSRPKRLLNICLSLGAALVLSILYLVVRERLKEEESRSV